MGQYIFGYPKTISGRSDICTTSYKQYYMHVINTILYAYYQGRNIGRISP